MSRASLIAGLAWSSPAFALRKEQAADSLPAANGLEELLQPPTSTGLEETILRGTMDSWDAVLSALQEYNPWKVNVLDVSKDPPRLMGGTTGIPEIDRQGNPYALYQTALAGVALNVLHRFERIRYGLEILKGEPDVPAGRTSARVVVRPAYNIPAAGLEEVEKFSSVEAFLESHRKHLGEEEIRAVEDLRSDSADVLVVPEQKVGERALVVVYPQWLEIAREKLASPFLEIIPYSEDLEYSKNLGVSGRTILLWKSGVLAPVLSNWTPTLIVYSPTEIARLNPSWVYSMAVNKALAGERIGPLRGILLFQEEGVRKIALLRSA